MIARSWRMSSNEFFIPDAISASPYGNDWYFGTTSDNNRMWGDLNFQLILSGNPITFTFTSVFNDGFGAQSYLPYLCFNCDLTPIDVQTSIERPLIMPQITRLFIRNNQNYTSVSTINIPVNANGRYRCRVLGIITVFSNIAPGSITLYTNNYLFDIKSQALNNFGYLGGSGYSYNTRDLDTSCMCFRKPEYFISGTIAGVIDITMTSVQSLATIDIRDMVMYLELLKINDKP
jgi:hypothetical protein